MFPCRRGRRSSLGNAAALPLIRGGEFAGMLESCRSAALELYRPPQRFPLLCRTHPPAAGYRGLGDTWRHGRGKLCSCPRGFRCRRAPRSAPRLGPSSRSSFPENTWPASSSSRKFAQVHLPPFRAHEAGTSGMDRPHLGSAASRRAGSPDHRGPCNLAIASQSSATPRTKNYFSLKSNFPATDNIRCRRSRSEASQ